MIFSEIKDFSLVLPGRFQTAFNFIKSMPANLPKGRTDIADGIYVNVMEYAADKPWEVSRLEAHRAYADIQIVLSGAEACACAFVSGHDIETPYSEKDDVMFYKTVSADCSRIELRPGFFALFFPEDGHLGQFAPATGAQSAIRKAVVKVKLK